MIDIVSLCWVPKAKSTNENLQKVKKKKLKDNEMYIL